MSRKWNKEALATILLFIILIYLFTKLLITEDIKNYVHPKFNKYLWASIVVFGCIIIANLMFLKQKRHNAPSKSILMIALVLLIVVIFPTKQAISTRIETVQKINMAHTSDKYRNKSIIHIPNNDYLKWYYDLHKNLNEYIDKEVTYNAKVVQKTKSQFVGARNVMVCCAADVASMGIEIEYNTDERFENNDWVQINGKILKHFDAKFQTYVPYISAISVKKIDPLKNDLLYP